MALAYRIKQTETLANDTYQLNKVTFEYQRPDGVWETQSRETYNKGNGACILLYNLAQETVILTQQFRLPPTLNGYDGLLLEVPAGVIEVGEAAESCILRETEEETGYRIKKTQKVFEAFTSPAAVTEVLYGFIAPYTPEMKVSPGGGLPEEHEHIEVIEMDFKQAITMVQEGKIRDAKTIMLLQYAQLHLFKTSRHLSEGQYD
jgi:GDP-mannose pyrophosphatase NudK